MLEKGEKYVLNEKQKQQLAAWHPSAAVSELLSQLRVVSLPPLSLRRKRRSCRRRRRRATRCRRS